MDFENEYFILRYDRPLDKAGYITNAPNIIMDSNCPPYDNEYKFIKNPEMMYYCFGKGTSKKPNMLDWLYPVLISEKLYSSLNTMNIRGLQLLPAIIKGNGKEYKYWFLNIYNVYSAFDFEKSDYEKSNIGTIRLINNIVFKKDVLQKIKLEDRLVFVLKEDKSEYFFHKKIVDKLMKIEPKSFIFIPVSEVGKKVDDDEEDW